MSRGDGFTVADVDSALLEDGKLRLLWRELGGEPCAMTHAVTLYTAVLLASWRHGCRVTLVEAVPSWLPLDERLAAALRKVRLVDAGGRIPARAWHHWYDPAFERREKRRERGRLGGLAAAGKPRKAQVQRKRSTSTPDRPSGRSVVASAKQPSRGRARDGVAAPRDEGTGLESLRSTLQRNGVLPAKDNGVLLSEPMPVAVSAAVGVDDA